MKFTITTLMLLLAACIGSPSEKTVSLPDYRNSKAPEVNPKSHKDKDVEIFRTLFMGNMYVAIMYRMDDGELKGYQANYGSNNNYDKASYSWTNDSTIVVKLFDSSSDLKESFSVIGNGYTTTLKEVD